MDTQGQGVEAITAKGVIANGVEHELDCIIFATGFEVGTEYTRRAGYDLIGKGGLKLSEKWSEGIKTLHGLHTQGFPNLFVISNAQSGFTVNFPHAMDEQAQHICYIVKECAAGNINTVEATAAAENAWVEEIIGMSRFSQEFLESCTPGYYNNEGQPNPKSIQNGSYGAGPDAFFAKIKQWRDEGTMEGLDLG